MKLQASSQNSELVLVWSKPWLREVARISKDGQMILRTYLIRSTVPHGKDDL